MGPLAAIALIGGGFLAVKKMEEGKNPSTPYDETQPNVQANADQMGYQTVSQEQAEAQGGLQAGQTMTVKNANGEIVETVTQTGEGAQIAQEADGTIHVRQGLDDQIEVEPVTMPAEKPVGTSVLVKPSPVIAEGAANPGMMTPAPTSFKPAGVSTPTPTYKPRRPISNALFNSRIMAATKRGIIIPH